MAMQQLGNETTTIFVDGLDLVWERIFDAPRELVWKALTEPERIPRWWGPRGTTTTVVEMDVRPGGAWRYINHSPDRPDVPFKGQYLEVVPPERLVYTFIVDIEPMNAETGGFETVVLEALGGKTKLTSRSHFPSAEGLDGALSTGMISGGIETWDRLEEELARG